MNFWTQKLGPLPYWAWAALTLAIVVAFMYWQSSQSKTSTTATTAATGTTATTSGDTQYPASEVPQWVNQTYTTVEPPTAPATGSSTTATGTTTATPAQTTAKPTVTTAASTTSGQQS